ncbi:hypothetical protein BHF70_02300 [Anaerostipes sp. 494a]|nr:hypothetical protein BHF70_02300 [Anaerostipes sp. 494a]
MIERILCMAIHISLTLIVFYGIKEKIRAKWHKEPFYPYLLSCMDHMAYLVLILPRAFLLIIFI